MYVFYVRRILNRTHANMLNKRECEIWAHIEVRFVYYFTALTLTVSGNNGRLTSTLVTNYCTFFFNFKVIENFDVKLT